MTGPVSTVGGYGSPTINSDTAALVDSEDGVPAIVPALNPVTGALSQAVVSGVAPPSTAVPPMNAILVELRVISALLHFQLGATSLDLEQMRADELYNSTPALNPGGVV